jgi:hypothetical protein
MPSQSGKPSPFVTLNIGNLITLGNLEFEVINYD